MIDSVERNTTINLNWHILALTEEARRLLQKNQKRNWEILSLATLNDQEFLDLKDSRPWREFCWTAASVALNYTAQNSTSDFVGYLDADCYFLADIADYFSDLRHSSVLIFRHDFSPDREEWLKKSGEFNVGLILGRRNEAFKTCIEDWRKEVLQECILDPKEGKCGDQTYLNSWPSKFSFVSICARTGSALGPWNTNNFFFLDNENWQVDGFQIHFYHFHGLLITRFWSRLFLYLSAPGYRHHTQNLSKLYLDYVQNLIALSFKLGVDIRVSSPISFIITIFRSRMLPRFFLMK